MASEDRVSIVIPAYNEREAIRAVISGLLARHGDKEIIVVDDGSQDGTFDEIKDLHGVKVIRHHSNRGYGASLKTGIRQAQGNIVVTFDADGQHRAEDIDRLIQKIDDNDMVVGARMGKIQSTFWRAPGKWILGWLANYLAGVKIPDLNSGLRAFRREIILDQLYLISDKFSFSTTSTLAFFSEGFRVEYIPIVPQERIGKSTVTLKTGFETLLLLLRLITFFNPLKVFLPASFIFGIAGGSMALYSILLYDRLWRSALLLLLLSILTFFHGLVADQISTFRKGINHRNNNQTQNSKGVHDGDMSDIDETFTPSDISKEKRP